MQNIFVALLSNYIDKKFTLSSKPQKQTSRPKSKRSKSQRPISEAGNSVCRASLQRSSSEPHLRHHHGETRPRTTSRRSDRSCASSSSTATRASHSARPGLVTHDPAYTDDVRHLKRHSLSTERSASIASDERPYLSNQEHCIQPDVLVNRLQGIQIF